MAYKAACNWYLDKLSSFSFFIQLSWVLLRGKKSKTKKNKHNSHDTNQFLSPFNLYNSFRLLMMLTGFFFYRHVDNVFYLVYEDKGIGNISQLERGL